MRSFSLEVKTIHFSEMTSLWLLLMVSDWLRSSSTAFPGPEVRGL